MPVPLVSLLPDPPLPTDPEQVFDNKVGASLLAQQAMVPEMNTQAEFTNQRAIDADASATAAAGSASGAAQAKADAELARDAAQNVANFKGAWSSLTGPLNPPASVTHNGQIWSLLYALGNVAASEPGVSADWIVQGGLDASKTANFTASRNAAYWLGSSLTVTLPDTTTPPPKGTFVRLTKALAAKPVVQAGAGSAVIATSKGNDTSVTFDVNAEIIFIFNGTNWEV